MSDEGDLEIYRGDSLQIDLEVTNDDGPVDFTGATFRLTIDTIDQTDATVTNGGATGIVSIFIGYDKMETLAAGDYEYDIEATWESEKRRETLVKGVLSVLEDVTV